MTNKPKRIIVDENDEIINHKDKEDIVKSDIYRVSALWIKNSQGEFLLAQRGLNKAHNPGQWGPAVAGTNDEGETYQSNIIKETEEEIGLKDFKLAKADKKKIKHDYNYFCQWFVAVIDKEIGEFQIQHDEVESLKWISREELIQEVEKNPAKYFSQVKYCLDNY